MKSYILYGSTVKHGAGYHIVTRGNQPPYYVRSAMIEGDVAHALEHAHPRDGEIVLNTVEIPEYDPSKNPLYGWQKERNSIKQD